MLYNPLEQFEINVVSPENLFCLFDVSITTFNLTMFFVIIFSLILLTLLTTRIALIPSIGQASGEMLYKFLFNLLKQQAGAKSEAYFPLVFAIFIFILFSNLFGLFPFGF